MIWNDTKLDMAALRGMVDPFDPALVNPASIDLRLGAAYRLPSDFPGVIWGIQFNMPDTGIVLEPRQFILCCTLETVRIPPDACAQLFSKSSTGRMGLEHLHAGWIDPGFNGQLTLEFHNVAPWPIRLVPGQRLMQMVVESMTAPAVRDYSQTGRYQGQTGATPARP
jgi:dCTP deaminase